tara:strand:- start:2350 stop:2661 length:312 start_codon:yes stop_codon:yes gene_type:complete
MKKKKMMKNKDEVLQEIFDNDPMGILDNKKEQTKKYINQRIDNKIYSKISYHEQEVKHYFKNRHTGFANLTDEQVYGLIDKSIKDLKVWRHIKHIKCSYDGQT